MNQFITYLLIGFGSGLIIFPIGLYIYNKIADTFERRKIKIMINKGEFLTPIDTKDYDTKIWSSRITHNPEDLKNFSTKIFTKPLEEDVKGGSLEK